MVALVTSLLLGAQQPLPTVSFARSEYVARSIPIGPAGKFTIAFTDASDMSLKLLRENCSWGYEMLSFEVANPAGGSYRITRKQIPWYRNVPSPFYLASGETLTRNINLGDGSWV